MPGTKLGTRQAQQKGSFFFSFLFSLLLFCFLKQVWLYTGRGVLQMDLVTNVSDPAGTVLAQCLSRTHGQGSQVLFHLPVIALSHERSLTGGDHEVLH